MPIDLDKMKKVAATLNNERTGGDKPSNFFRPEKGKTYTLRLMPDEEGAPMKMYAQHYGLGQTFVCPKKTFSQKCAVCDHIISEWRDSSEAVQNGFKKISAKMRWYSVVFVRETGEVAVWSYSPTVAKQLLALFQDPDYDDISDPKNGCDIEMKIVQDPKKQYADTIVKPKRKSSPLVATTNGKYDEEGVSALMEKIPNIKESMNIISQQEISDMFLSYSLKGSNNAPDDDTDDSDSAPSGEEPKPGKNKKSEPAPGDDIPF
jgi:hypothetical protein